ncbi:DUF2254 domain-containing protein [Chachezhania sediminis]|uniref:DUF2254 domain-containing protein n=1 Tax=Chachezhania sediminis TaxID=2599291 RepID=UPI00131EAC91|nr:DUF2254 domain-containing protein [Chachezhania sediminis]
MLRSLLRTAIQISRRIYVRVILYAVASVAVLGIAIALEPFIPEDLGFKIGADAVDTILQVLASSMLAVTTFSLTIMASGLANAAGNWTPRSHLVLREDTVVHTVLGTFVGSFLFALIGIILRAAHFFDERGTVVLFGATILVAALVVVNMIRWIVHLEGLGSLPATLDALEDEARATVAEAVAHPCHGGRDAADWDGDWDAAGTVLRSDCHGYLQQIFEDMLQKWADQHDARVLLQVQVGDHVLAGTVLARVSGVSELGKADAEHLRQALPLRPLRSFDEDPIFAVTLLTEVAEKALSPGINDPGTAVDVVARLARVIAADTSDCADLPERDRLYIRPLDPERMFRAAFDPIAREAGHCVEVHRALAVALDQLAEAGPGILQTAARDCARRCRERAEAAVPDGPDRDWLDRSGM